MKSSFGDVLLMAVTNIMLGWPQLYDLDVAHAGGVNAYSFIHNDNKLMLCPTKSKSIIDNKKKDHLLAQMQGSQDTYFYIHLS